MRLLAVWAFLVVGLAVRAFAGGLLGTRQGQGDPSIAPAVIDINRAGLSTLQALPGVGAVKAEAIVLDRVRRGPFRVVEDLDRVDGIGRETVEALRPFVTVERGPTPPVGPR